MVRLVYANLSQNFLFPFHDHLFLFPLCISYIKQCLILKYTVDNVSYFLPIFVLNLSLLNHIVHLYTSELNNV